jgi:hypothetical protein
VQSWEEAGGEWRPGLFGVLAASQPSLEGSRIRQPRDSTRLLVEEETANARLCGRASPCLFPLGDEIGTAAGVVGSGMAKAVRQTIREGRPRLDHIELTRRRPAGGLVAYRYFRLMLPWRGRGGEAHVTAHRWIRSAAPLD